MHELMKVSVNERQEQVVSMRELHERLGIAKPFTQWWEQQANRLGLTEGRDYFTCKLRNW